MIKTAIISDIHSNLEALSKVLKDISRRRVDKVICLGDIIGYGPNPKECLSIIRQEADIIIMGNHEHGTVSDNLREFNNIAAKAILYSKNQLDEDDKGFIRSLPKSVLDTTTDISIAHGSYSSDNMWTYIDNPEAARYELSLATTKYTLVGHTHSAFVFGSTNGLYNTIPSNMALNEDDKYLINVGSVGQPRDGDCRASYGILEDDTFNLHQIFYNIDKTVRKINRARLPLVLAERLFGGW